MKSCFVAGGICALATLGAMPAAAQSTDGYHSNLIFPVVVDSASFTQRFTFRNPFEGAIRVKPQYFPGTGTSQPTPLDCPEFEIAADGQSVFTSLRDLCPALADGSQFGYLYVSDDTLTNRIFAGFSRVSNIAGQGFTVEAFPAHTFTSADSVVTGLRRLAATPSSPAYQSNCFIGNLNDISGTASTDVTRVDYALTDSSGAALGNGFIDLAPGKLTRVLDIFAAAGATAGNHDDATIIFRKSGTAHWPGLMSFCTVQDNSSFGADFRIAKQEKGHSLVQGSGIGAHDDHVNRDSIVSADALMSGSVTPRPFVIPPGAFSNTHVLYFRHPDYAQCELIDPATGVRALPAYGLEMRFMSQNGTTVIAGGAGSTGFGKVYLGDKTDRNVGSNTRYTVEVESSTVNTAASRPYKLHCQSGSGHTLGDIVQYQTPGDRF